MADITIVIGVIGFVFLFAGFILNATKKLSQNSFAYLFLNVIGAGLLAYYAYTIKSIPFIILEGTWAVFSAYQLIRVQKE